MAVFRSLTKRHRKVEKHPRVLRDLRNPAKCERFAERLRDNQRNLERDPITFDWITLWRHSGDELTPGRLLRVTAAAERCASMPRPRHVPRTLPHRINDKHNVPSAADII